MTVSSLTALPVLPLRDIVVFPHMIVPLFVGRQKAGQSCVETPQYRGAEEQEVQLETKQSLETTLNYTSGNNGFIIRLTLIWGLYDQLSTAQTHK